MGHRFGDGSYTLATLIACISCEMIYSCIHLFWIFGSAIFPFCFDTIGLSVNCHPDWRKKKRRPERPLGLCVCVCFHPFVHPNHPWLSVLYARLGKGFARTAQSSTFAEKARDKRDDTRLTHRRKNTIQQQHTHKKPEFFCHVSSVGSWPFLFLVFSSSSSISFSCLFHSFDGHRKE